MTVRFSEAWSVAYEFADEVRRADRDVILVRDVVGRLSLIVGGEPDEDLPAAFTGRVGAFSSPNPVLYMADLFEPGVVLDSPDLHVRAERSDGVGRLATLDRSLVGADWSRPHTDTPGRNRTTLYGFKGGVGRSTATAMLADHLANLGECVLVVDLDLESPGVGALLQNEDGLPEHGVIDHLVEAAVDNEADLDLVSRSTLLGNHGNGEVWIAPAAGRVSPDDDYLGKLNRVYTDLPPTDDGTPRRFGDRLEAAIVACEEQVTKQSRRPSVVLLDSRAGIHDIAAAAITQLSDTSLLFAADNPQTWNGYGILFKQWQRHLPPEALDHIRRRLRMVASMVPPNNASNYLDLFRDHAQQCFAETLYDDAHPDDFEAFNFASDDRTAPHSPLPILFNSDLISFDPVRRDGWHTQPLIAAAYRPFLEEAATLLVGSR
ncbi:AAA family ATPase [Saccharothrix violaceirubra]|uniref:CobQ/CobB/MinD/ParA nucleotide binding domain-containing protein n=1 Tax=Saccharothrix violaceirubra TaxID=413306 RepID=A0A7W7SY53_9PSEU|nr:P-loop NTPase [Saccharothrix violaceirubra]MBB4963044.1 hypothetical protein [Saccharothrix violaceirubra]